MVVVFNTEKLYISTYKIELFDISTFMENCSLLSLQTSPVSENELLICYDRNNIYLWDVMHRQVRKIYETESPVTSISWSNDGKLFATGHQSGDITLWKRKSTTPLSKINVFKSDGKRPISKISFTKINKSDAIIFLGGTDYEVHSMVSIALIGGKKHQIESVKQISTDSDFVSFELVFKNPWERVEPLSIVCINSHGHPIVNTIAEEEICAVPLPPPFIISDTEISFAKIYFCDPLFLSHLRDICNIHWTGDPRYPLVGGEFQDIQFQIQTKIFITVHMNNIRFWDVTIQALILLFEFRVPERYGLITHFEFLNTSRMLFIGTASGHAIIYTFKTNPDIFWNFGTEVENGEQSETINENTPENEESSSSTSSSSPEEEKKDSTSSSSSEESVEESSSSKEECVITNRCPEFLEDIHLFLQDDITAFKLNKKHHLLCIGCGDILRIFNIQEKKNIFNHALSANYIVDLHFHEYSGQKGAMLYIMVVTNNGSIIPVVFGEKSPKPVHFNSKTIFTTIVTERGKKIENTDPWDPVMPFEYKDNIQNGSHLISINEDSMNILALPALESISNFKFNIPVEWADIVSLKDADGNDECCAVTIDIDGNVEIYTLMDLRKVLNRKSYNILDEYPLDARNSIAKTSLTKDGSLFIVSDSNEVYRTSIFPIITEDENAGPIFIVEERKIPERPKPKTGIKLFSTTSPRKINQESIFIAPEEENKRIADSKNEVNETRELLQETMERLSERGDKISELQEKTQEMEDQSFNFLKNAEELSRRTQKSSWPF
eukprot:TRINITY_DN5636_c0_g1_i2.p1 TRINITY_DN5636_c0_g1~~TRINITY_DN5636_c0_g1_i2.p1  ORF type:complete len:781 (-),score=166.20 TRINITY_DN5636_c0_g1_i2:107-2449(-)